MLVTPGAPPPGRAAGFHASPFQGYGVEWSPFDPHRLAVASSQNYGIVGNGAVHVIDVTPRGVVEVASFPTLDGCYDVAWSEASDRLVATAGGDGAVRLWDVAAPPRANPLRAWAEHAREVHSLDWGLVRRDVFVSTSWDDTARLWSPESPRALRSFAEHGYCVYSASWCPTDAEGESGRERLRQRPRKRDKTHQPPSPPPPLHVPSFRHSLGRLHV